MRLYFLEKTHEISIVSKYEPKRISERAERPFGRLIGHVPTVGAGLEDSEIDSSGIGPQLLSAVSY